MSILRISVDTYSLRLLNSRAWVMEKAMAPHSSTLAWKISWTEEPGRLQSMGSLRVGHNRATSLSLSSIGEGNGNPLQRSCLENPGDGGAWWAAVYVVAQSRTWLKWLSSSSSRAGIRATSLANRALVPWGRDFASKTCSAVTTALHFSSQTQELPSKYFHVRIV